KQRKRQQAWRFTHPRAVRELLDPLEEIDHRYRPSPRPRPNAIRSMRMPMMASTSVTAMTTAETFAANSIHDLSQKLNDSRLKCSGQIRWALGLGHCAFRSLLFSATCQ